MAIDELLVFHCAPTLAGLKMAALICVPDDCGDEAFTNMINSYNEKYNRQGLYFQVVSTCKNRKLVYIYRASWVAAHLQREEIKEFLVPFGYDATDTVQEHLQHLSKRLDDKSSFPHELGVFLGYPLEDVKAFIQHRGKEAKLVGEWVVYDDVSHATIEFKKYKTCRKCYVDMFNRGFTVDRLIIA